MKEKIIGFLVALSPALMMAQGTPTVNTQGVADVGNAVSTAVQSASTTLQPILVTIIVAGIGLWLVVTLPGILKRAWGSGKGR